MNGVEERVHHPAFKGRRGAQGLQGPVGPAITGPNGVQGPAGGPAVGPQGVAGITTLAVGPRGDQGNIGFYGPNGVQGPAASIPPNNFDYYRTGDLVGVTDGSYEIYLKTVPGTKICQMHIKKFGFRGNGVGNARPAASIALSDRTARVYTASDFAPYGQVPQQFRVAGTDVGTGQVYTDLTLSVLYNDIIINNGAGQNFNYLQHIYINPTTISYLLA